MVRSPKVMVPRVGVSIPDRAYSRVDLPAPLAPMMTVKSPLYSSRSMFFRTCCMEPPLENALLSFSVFNRTSFIVKYPPLHVLF